MDFIRENIPGFKNSFCMQSASCVGVRESRHFIGEYILEAEDIVDQCVFDDWIVSNAKYCFNNHNQVGSGLDETRHNVSYRGQKYTIPYRSLLPKGVSNLLLNGRNISGTHLAHSSFRVMPICFGMGDGAGIAAAHCIAENKPLRQADIKRVQEVLLSCGVEFPTPVPLDQLTE